MIRVAGGWGLCRAKRQVLNVRAMVRECIQCGAASPETGLLCTKCAGALVGNEALLPDHITARTPPADAVAWLIDQWGHAHAIGLGTTAVGRMPEHDLLILNSTVSRNHAQLLQEGGEWAVCDLGSRNWTRVNGDRVQGKGRVASGDRLSFGEAGFYFRTEIPGASPPTKLPGTTGYAASSRTFRFTIRGDAVGKELCILGSRDTADATVVGGALLYRDRGTEDWQESNLASLEFQLLTALCRKWIEEGTSPSKSRGCITTKRLAKILPFKSKYPNEENVRQVVRRLRATLKGIGIEGLIQAAPGRGYHLTWPVSSL